MNKIVFATNNKNKAEEVQALLGPAYKVLTLEDIGCQEDIPETAGTLDGNAKQKAAYVYNKYGMNCFADDTGLEVESLGGEPGIYSARYAGSQRNSEDNMALLLQKMEGKTNRNARFRTVVALVIDGEYSFFEGIAEGEITTEKSGVKGFGYDPIFLPKNQSKTFAELTKTAKNKISHRGKAVRKLINYLKNR